MFIDEYRHGLRSSSVLMLSSYRGLVGTGAHDHLRSLKLRSRFGTHYIPLHPARNLAKFLAVQKPSSSSHHRRSFDARRPPPRKPGLVSCPTHMDLHGLAWTYMDSHWRLHPLMGCRPGPTPKQRGTQGDLPSEVGTPPGVGGFIMAVTY